MTGTLGRNQISFASRELSTDELEDIRESTRKEIERLRLGKYKFRPETRCRICTDDETRKLVDSLLTGAMTYTQILKTIEPLNRLRPKNNKITYNSIMNHSKVHFPTNDAAQAIYREILEQRAEEYGQDFVKGTTSIINVFSYLETVQQKGYAKLVSSEDNVTVADGMNAAVKLHDLMKQDDADEQVRVLVGQLDRIVRAIKNSVPEEYQREILASLTEEEHEEPLDVDYEEEDEVTEFEPIVEEEADAGGSH